MQKFLSTRFSIVSRSKGYSAVDKASYISREQLYSEYDGRTYIPTKPNEDLVHSEINLPDNAPREYSDRATLWNAVEMVEKSKNAQLCRMMKHHFQMIGLMRLQRKLLENMSWIISFQGECVRIGQFMIL